MDCVQAAAVADQLPGWPRCLSRDEAAAYLGVSPGTFDAEVRAGYWPKPDRRGAKGGRVTWDRLLLDATQDRHSRLKMGNSEPEDLEATPNEVDAWKERIHATAPQQRPQRHPQAPR
jgi:hypothetical protein